MERAFLRSTSRWLAAAALLALVQTPCAQTMEGDQILSWGIGMRTRVAMNALRTNDIGDPAFPSDFSADPKESALFVHSLQYFYQATPRWAFGLITEYNEYTGGTASFVQPSNTPSGQVALVTTDARMRNYEVVPSAKYFFMDQQRVNPYVLGGLGVNHLYSTTSWSKSYNAIFGFTTPPSQSGQVHRSSTGLAVILGGGVQATLMKWLLVGLEGRYEALQTSSSAFGRSSWSSTSGYLWIGTKWNAPF